MQPTHEVPVEVLPPVPMDARQPATTMSGDHPPFAGWRGFYHPASGIAILGIDFLVFGTELFTGFLTTVPMSILAFVVTLPLVYLIQTKWGLEKKSSAFGKALIGAIAAGLPFSIAGTVYGAAILAMSGLPHHPVEMLKRLATGRSLIGPK